MFSFYTCMCLVFSPQINSWNHLIKKVYSFKVYYKVKFKFKFEFGTCKLTKVQAQVQYLKLLHLNTSTSFHFFIYKMYLLGKRHEIIQILKQMLHFLMQESLVCCLEQLELAVYYQTSHGDGQVFNWPCLPSYYYATHRRNQNTNKITMSGYK